MLTHRFSNSRIYLLTLGILVLALLFIYQTGGYVDGFDIQARNESLRDYGVWVRARVGQLHLRTAQVLHRWLLARVSW